MSTWKTLLRPPWCILISVAMLLLLSGLVYKRFLWIPGKDITDGRHDLGRNAIWIQHGWLGSDRWFRQNKRTNEISHFRSVVQMQQLASLLREHHITDVYPHLCPTQPDGSLPSVDAEQTTRFLHEFANFRVMPWVGGNLDFQLQLQEPKWRQSFISSICTLLNTYTNLSGVHLNIGPMPSGNKDLVSLLDELRAAIPKGKLVSLAAYPPPTRSQPSLEVHWEESYFREVARHADQMVIMMYDTSIRRAAPYQSLLSTWTKQVLAWAPEKNVLLGVAVYESANILYHDPQVENITNSLMGIHCGLADLKTLPANYQGIAIYSEWEMDPFEWQYLRGHFLKH